mmetsp:Transcript_47859/g.113726  ORF Transcript_47859/g.113726 Transcript_47859/m.113726 type:complete len:311 (+) Transcript_47859:116-1048(+)
MKPRQQRNDAIERLVILDMNGVLLKRTRNNRKIAEMRPHLDEFLDRLWKLQTRGVKLAVWSSMKEFNLWPLVEEVFGSRVSELEFVWDQASCTESWPADMAKPLLSKELSKLSDTEWSDFLPDRVLLIDDDPVKCTCNDEFTAVHPSSFQGLYDDAWEQVDDSELLQLASYLESLADSGRSVQDFLCDNPYSDFRDEGLADYSHQSKRRRVDRSEAAKSSSSAQPAAVRDVEAYWPSSKEWLPARVVQEMNDGSFRIHWQEDGSESVVPWDYVREVRNNSKRSWGAQYQGGYNSSNEWWGSSKWKHSGRW